MEVVADELLSVCESSEYELEVLVIHCLLVDLDFCLAKEFTLFCEL